MSKGENVQVKVELGHKAVKKKQPAKDGFTHDWTVFVRGPDGSRIEHFIERVVFKLHESFPKSKRAVKEPPYHVSESGYAGFNLPIDIHFKNKEEPKKIRFVYDLFLQLDETPVSNIRCEKLTFQNPTEEFKRKLLKAGGVVVNPNGEPKVSPSNQHSSHHAPGFTELFGPPIHTETPKKQNKSGTSSKEKEKSSKPKSSSSTSSSKPHTPSNSQSSSTVKTPSSASSTASSSSSSKEKEKSKSRESYGKRPPSSPLPTHSEAARKKMKCSSSNSPPSQETSKSSKDNDKSKHKEHSKKSKSSEKESKLKVEKSSQGDKTEKKEKSKSSDVSSQKGTPTATKPVARPLSAISRKSISSLSSLSSSSSESSSDSNSDDDSPGNSSCSFNDSLLNISKGSEKRKSIAARGFNAAMKELNALSDDESSEESNSSDSDSEDNSSPEVKKRDVNKSVSEERKIHAAEEKKVSMEEKKPSSDDKKTKTEEKKTPVVEEKKVPSSEEKKVPKERKVWDALFSKSKNQDEKDKVKPEKEKHSSKSKSSSSKHEEKGKSEESSSKHKSSKSSKPSSHKSGGTKPEKSDNKDHKSSDKKNEKSSSKSNKERKSSSHGKEKEKEKKIEDKVKLDIICNGADSEDEKKTDSDTSKVLNNASVIVKDKDHKPQPSVKNENNTMSAQIDSDKNVEKSDCGEDVRVLLKLQDKLMTLQDRDILQKVVDVIEKTSLFSISDKTFDFDLCRLDRGTLDEIMKCIED